MYVILLLLCTHFLVTPSSVSQSVSVHADVLKIVHLIVNVQVRCMLAKTLNRIILNDYLNHRQRLIFI